MNTTAINFTINRGMPIVKLVNEIIERAEKSGASDIHIDPRLDGVRIRFRIDGVLHDVCIMPREIHGEFVARIKIISGLRIDERIVPQDGRLTFGETLDVRVTTIASYYGESVVMRLLRRTAKVLPLEGLGFSMQDTEKISRSVAGRQGLILVTGPTGSGKTTTLYSLLSLVSDTSVSTVTIEDPVEYAMPNTRQIQVQQKRGINFANGLRSILRQDPDVIMVGEIRDYETAAIATSAALTGHLVLSTLHTNDAVSTIVRCIEMGIAPYLVAATVRLIVSQRLVRKLCLSCRQAVALGIRERAVLQKYAPDILENAKPDFLQMYESHSCPKCSGTGYAGRTVVAEILPMTQAICQMIVERRPISEVYVAARAAGVETLYRQALLKCARGDTSFEEVIKTFQE